MRVITRDSRRQKDRKDRGAEIDRKGQTEAD